MQWGQQPKAASSLSGHQARTGLSSLCPLPPGPAEATELPTNPNQEPPQLVLSQLSLQPRGLGPGLRVHLPVPEVSRSQQRQVHAEREGAEVGGLTASLCLDPTHGCLSSRMLCCGLLALLLSWTSLAADTAAAVVSLGLGVGVV